MTPSYRLDHLDPSTASIYDLTPEILGTRIPEYPGRFPNPVSRGKIV